MEIGASYMIRTDETDKIEYAPIQRFPATDPGLQSYWEDNDDPQDELIRVHEITNIAELKALLAQKYSADIVKKLILIALQRKEECDAGYSPEELYNYTL